MKPEWPNPTLLLAVLLACLAAVASAPSGRDVLHEHPPDRLIGIVNEIGRATAAVEAIAAPTD